VARTVSFDVLAVAKGVGFDELGMKIEGIARDSRTHISGLVTAVAAAVDHHGLRVEAAWMPTERAQALRAMVRSGAKLGLSIDYFPDVARPHGAGGRFLDKVTVVGGAVTPKPMNAAATITEGKHAVGGFAQVLTVAEATAQESARRERESPQTPDGGRDACCRVLAAAVVRPGHAAGADPGGCGGQVEARGRGRPGARRSAGTLRPGQRLQQCSGRDDDASGRGEVRASQLPARSVQVPLTSGPADRSARC
jgi:hypothetical protein